MNGLDDAGIVSGSLVAASILVRGVVSVFKWQKDLTIKTDLQNKLLFGDPKNLIEYPGLRQWQQDTRDALEHAAQTAATAAGAAASAASAASSAAKVAAALDRGQKHIIDQLEGVKTVQAKNVKDIRDLAAAWIPNGGSAEVDKIRTSLSAIEHIVTAEARKPNENPLKG